MPPVDYADGTVVPGTRYRVARPLSTSGMGVVYEVEDISIGRRFVLKTLHSTLRDEGNLARRLATEARVLARLEHPNIVAIVTAGVTEDELRLPYFVMERLEGQTLRAVLDAKGRLPLPAVYTVGIEILDALDCAHRQGVVHRDVKPENVFLHRSADGSAITKLLDFGVVSVLESAGHDTGERFLGTPRYASPEQCRGEKPLPSSDLYAAGLILYEMLTGASPFEGVHGRGGWLEAHAFRAPRPLPATLGVPAALDALVLSSLRKTPGERPVDAFTFAAELRRLKGDGAAAPGGVTPGSAPPGSVPPGPVRRLSPPPSPVASVTPYGAELGPRLRTAAAVLGAAAPSQRARAVTLFAQAVRRAEASLHEALARDAQALGAIAQRQAVLALADLIDTAASLPDATATSWDGAAGARAVRARVPLGVVAFVGEGTLHEDVVACALALRTGNAAVLGSASPSPEARLRVAALLRGALEGAGLPEDAVAWLAPAGDGRAFAFAAAGVQLAVVRGMDAPARAGWASSSIPWVEVASPETHLFLDAGASASRSLVALRSLVAAGRAYLRRVTVLVHGADAPRLVPEVVAAVRAEGLGAAGCPRSRGLAADLPAASGVAPPGVVRVAVVAGLDEALTWVAHHGAGHTEAIVTASAPHGARWRREVRAAVRLVNAVRLGGGGDVTPPALDLGVVPRHAFGAGPLTAEALTTLTWEVDGEGRVR